MPHCIEPSIISAAHISVSLANASFRIWGISHSRSITLAMKPISICSVAFRCMVTLTAQMIFDDLSGMHPTAL